MVVVHRMMGLKVLMQPVIVGVDKVGGEEMVTLVMIRPEHN